MKAVIKRGLNFLRHSHIKKDIRCKSKWFGNKYGGFYVIPSLIRKNAIVYSFGVGKDISFDRALINSFDCQIVAFDPTPDSISWCKQQSLPEKFKLNEYGLSNKSEMVTFFLPKNKNHVSGSLVGHSKVSSKNTVTVKMKSFNDILKDLKHNTIDLIKMDIEGSEYNVVESIPCSEINISQIVLEIHERFFHNGKEKTIKLLETFRKKGFLLHSISSSYEELSFVNSKAIQHI
jgi:FkbM family methyltransferase